MKEFASWLKCIKNTNLHNQHRHLVNKQNSKQHTATCSSSITLSLLQRNDSRMLTAYNATECWRSSSSSSISSRNTDIIKTNQA